MVEFKGRLGLCWSHGLQRRHLLEKLHNKHKEIQGQGEHRRSRVNAALGPGKLPAIAREDGNRQEKEREDAQNRGGQQAMEGK